MPADWTEELDRAVDAAWPRMVEVRRHLHAHPEPSGSELQTTVYLQGVLQASGWSCRTGEGGLGLIVEPAGQADGPRAAVRADIDALFIQDAKAVPYRSQHPGVMHACGHDAHAATVLGALWGLQALEAAGTLPWPVRWRGIFQPAEETSLGAQAMIAAGALERVGAIFALHVDPARPLGRIGLRDGPLTAACDDLEIRIEGRGGHAARPHESLDPIAAAAQLISSIYLFVPRGVDSHDPVVVTIGQIIAGDNPNVIPSEVRLRGTVRTLGGQVREQTKDHIRKLARGIAEASGTRIAVDFVAGPGSVTNDSGLTALVRDAAGALLGSEQIDQIARPSMGAEDFAGYLDHVPGSMFRLGCRGPDTPDTTLHAANFDIDEQAMAIGAKILARAVVAWFDPAR